jgi:UDP-2-acetamido-3-amino-2,3-dideoxy-glucuronate N-acetyltransferase
MLERSSRKVSTTTGPHRELRVGVVGVGRWGKRLLRVFSAVPRSRLVAACDTDARALAAAGLSYPGVRLFSSSDELFGSSAADAIVLATPSATHAKLTLRALDAGKHVFVEKPMATCAKDAILVQARVRRSGKVLMVGHVLEFHPSFVLLRALIRAGTLGDVRFVFSERIGPTPSGMSDPWWELAPHDFSLVRSITGREPERVAARRTEEDIIAADVRLPDGIQARIVVGRSNRQPKSRSTVVVGSRGAAIFDGVADESRLDVLLPQPGLREWLAAFAHQWAAAGREMELCASDLSHLRRHSTMSSGEPLANEAAHFVDGILDGAEISTDANNGLSVVLALDAGQRSLLEDGRPIMLRARHPPADDTLSGAASGP